jgi:leucine dehydrogenase
MLFDRKITYAPDYVANAGGIIAVAAEYFRNGTSVGVKERINAIYYRVLEVLTIADKRKIAPHIVADEIAEQKILQAARPSEHRASSC